MCCVLTLVFALPSSRAKAKKALQGYIAKYPKSFLPHRYMVRILGGVLPVWLGL